MLFRGQFTICLDRARKGVSYKYLVVNNREVYWEGLPEFPPIQSYGIVNRFLKIPKPYLKPGGK